LAKQKTIVQVRELLPEIVEFLQGKENLPPQLK
jgi:hypothetical protein